MDHRPFDDWLLDRTDLDDDQRRQLDGHLKVCPSCRALREVDRTLESVRAVAPAAGFADRFNLRLAARRQALRRRNFWGFLFLSLNVLALLVRVAWPLLGPALQSPASLLAAWSSRLLSLWASLLAVFRAGVVLVDVVPPVLWIGVSFAAACWALLWVFSWLKFTKLPQGA